MSAVDQLDAMISYENGELSHEGTVELFQGLIESGLAWQLQGHYGRQANALIRAGECCDPNAGRPGCSRCGIVGQCGC